MTGPMDQLLEKVQAEQRPASDPTASVWVTANAGSGKTRILVDRIIRLMLSNCDMQRILCLTFTRAAAAEMETRLFDRLAEWSTLSDPKLEEEIRRLTGRMVDADQLLAARRLFARALDVPGGLKLETIHGFCQSLIGRFPIEAGVAPHVSVMDDREAEELMRAARDRVLVMAEEGGELAEAMSRLVIRLDESGFDRLMAELTRNRGKMREMVAAGTEIAARRMRKLLGLAENETRQSVISDYCDDAAFDAAGLARAAAALESGSDKDRERAAIIRAWLGGPVSRPSLIGGDYLDLFLTQKGEPRAEKTLISKSLAADPQAVAAILAEQARLLAFRDKLKAAEVAEATADLLRLSAAMLEAYEAEKSTRALLDYDDLILKTQDLLGRQGGVSWVLYKLDGGIDHILIDEAQDTSPEQWDVIRALAEEFFAGAGAREELVLPRTLFTVGDEKQSIFSFQGADLAVFEAMHEHFKTRAQESRRDFVNLPLERSFRTAPAVLHAVDRVFARDAARDGVVLPGSSLVHQPLREGDAGLVEIWDVEKPVAGEEPDPWDAPLDQMAEDSPPSRLARRIANTIHGWIENKEILLSRGRPIEAQDIMILVRRRNDFFDEMVRTLKLQNIPVAGTDRMVLSDQLAVMDLVALGQFALLPEDDLTLATVLKGPLFCLNDDDLIELGHRRDGSLWQALKSRASENPQWQAARDELAEILSRADFVPPFEFYAAVLAEREGRKRMIARLGFEANDPINEFLSLAIAYGAEHPPSLQGFLQWFSRNPIEVKRDLEIARREVRVMTVHGAKGLEAEIVFLPDTCAVPDHRQESRLIWADGMMLWPVRKENEERICAGARAEEKRRRDQEYRRLLYVAMTRARDRLYVCGYEKKKARPAGCWYDLVREALSDVAQPVKLKDGTEVLRLANDQRWPPRDGRKAATIEQAGALPSWAILPPAPEPPVPVPLAPSRPLEAEPPALSPLAGPGGHEGEAVRRGRIIHRLLELLPPLSAAEREPACRRFLGLSIHGLDQTQIKAITAETLAILSDPVFGHLFGPGSRAEVPLAGKIGDRVIAGQVDRLLVTDGEVHIVDYKTNRPVPDSADQAPVAYLKQMAAYRAVLTEIYPKHSVRCALLWTVAPKLMPISKEILDRHAP